MAKANGLEAKIIDFSQLVKKRKKPRKSGLNKNKQGSVRKVNRKVYVDFMYLGERVREYAGLKWNENNAKYVRRQLDKIIIDIESETFSFAKVFPESKNKDH